ncbi:MAG: DNA-3-methyladenine glycosylase [Bacteroidota bacterium]
MLLPRSFYLRPDVVQIARDLLGKHLITRMDGVITSGIISETEAYAGITDRASHAFGGRRTARTEVMYAQGGTAYIYLCYGVHSLFNVVTNVTDIPHAVLIRGVIPVLGKEIILQRAGRETITRNLGLGPGRVSKILGIHFKDTGLDLTGKHNGTQSAIWIEDHGETVLPEDIKVTSRIGVSYAGEDAALPYRFRSCCFRSLISQPARAASMIPITK